MDSAHHGSIYPNPHRVSYNRDTSVFPPVLLTDSYTFMYIAVLADDSARINGNAERMSYI